MKGLTMKASLLFIAAVTISCCSPAEIRDFLSKSNDEDWKILDIQLRKIKFLFLEQEEQYVDLDTMASSDILAFPNVAPFKDSKTTAKYMNKKPALKLEEFMIDVDDSWIKNVSIAGESYIQGRQIIRSVLDQFVKAPTTHLTNLCRQWHSNDNMTQKIPEFMNQAINDSNLHTTLSPDFNRINFMKWSKAIIGDFISYQMIENGICSNKKSEPNEAQWQALINALIRADKRVSQEWIKMQLEHDVKELAKSKSIIAERGIQHCKIIKEFLAQKYFWNEFRVHTYADDYTEDMVKLMVGPNSKLVAVTVQKNYFIVVHWYPNQFSTSDDGLTSSISTLSPPHIDSTTRKPPTDHHKRDKAFDMVESISGMMATALSDSKDKVKKVASAGKNAMKNFKPVLKTIGLIGKFLGPLASGVSAILSLFDGSSQQLDEIQKDIQQGFADMRNSFTELDTHLDETTKEIKEVIESTADFYSKKVPYFTDVHNPLAILLGHVDDVFGPHGDEEKYKTDLHSFCKSSPENKYSPGMIFDYLKLYYFDQEHDFTKSILRWASNNRQSTDIHRFLMQLSMDAVNVGMLVTSGCAGFGYDDASFPLFETAKATRIIQKVLTMLYETYNEFMYEWHGNVLANTVTGLLKNKQYGDNQKQQLVTDIESTLSDTFRGNNFNAFVYNRHESWRNPVFWSIFNPDYVTYVEFNDWHIFINWNLAAETDDQPNYPITVPQLFADGSSCPIIPKYGPSRFPSNTLANVKNNGNSTIRCILGLMDTAEVFTQVCDYRTQQCPFTVCDRCHLRIWKSVWNNQNCCANDVFNNGGQKGGFLYKRHDCEPNDYPKGDGWFEKSRCFEAYLVNYGNGY